LTALRCSRLRCHRPQWSDGPSCVHDITLDFEEGRLHGITGTNGSGKTLLMHLLGLLDEPDFGSIELFGETVSPAPEEIRREIRNTVFGYVFPNPCLLPAFTVAENIAMPLFRISGADEHAAHDRVAELLGFVGIEPLANDPASTLDSDAQFLTALARAIVHRPRVLLLLGPSRPATLMPHVRRIINDLQLTAIWAGPKDDWLLQCDRTITLDCGAVTAESAALS
jgi:ABC-type lipoprotein export system ATPase subunit